jgi:hypothetical protein
MGLATYAIVAVGSRWGILHDGNVEGDHVTKESAFEAAIAAASLAIREGASMVHPVLRLTVKSHPTSG